MWSRRWCSTTINILGSHMSSFLHQEKHLMLPVFVFLLMEKLCSCLYWLEMLYWDTHPWSTPLWERMLTGTGPCGPYVWFLLSLWGFLVWFFLFVLFGGVCGMYFLFFFQLRLKEQGDPGPGVTLTNGYRGGKMKVWKWCAHEIFNIRCHRTNRSIRERERHILHSKNEKTVPWALLSSLYIMLRKIGVLHF